MKINAAAIGIVNRAGQQVVKINRHCQYHDHPCVLPAMFKEKKGYYSGKQKMDAKVKRGIKHEVAIP